ncbi:DUF4334 domain-containing protein [Streptomyces sp. NPDC000594]|uniref:DUF4334 domain-containing protein n=1 Tax=Streptomyces sp. NPDC000594 TaxID=3154261 RepID=UPI003330A673
MNPLTLRQQFLALERGDRVDHRRVEEVFDACGPVEYDLLMGAWRGTPFRTGHTAVAQLDTMNWYGKSFRSRWDVSPVTTRDGTGKVEESAEYGGAGLWRVEFRGVVSAAMVYDRLPVVDHFRRLDDDTLIGAMDGGPDILDDGRHLYFSLRRE